MGFLEEVRYVPIEENKCVATLVVLQDIVTDMLQYLDAIEIYN
jgi:hypothetical protein